MDVVGSQFLLTAPLYLFVLAGFGAAKFLPLGQRFQALFAKVIFTVLLPLLLFGLLSDSSKFGHPSWGVLGAYFGGCLVVFLIGLVTARYGLRLSGAEGAVFGVGSVFSNNVMLGLPLAQLTLGAPALPTVALVLVFNSLILWTLVTIAVETARHGRPNLRGLARTFRGVLVNPIIVGIILGTFWALTGWPLPDKVRVPLGWVSQLAGPLALVSLGMSLASYGGVREAKVTGALTAMKLLAHPLVVGILAWALGLSAIEVQALVLLASLAIGVNVYLMANQFGVLEKAVSQALLVSTFVSTVTTPLLLSLVPLLY